MSSTEYIRPRDGARDPDGSDAAHDAHEHTHEHGHHHGHEVEVDPYPWTDAKRYLWLLGVIPAVGLFLSMPFVAGFNALGWEIAATAAWFLLPVLVYVAIPLGDLAIGADGENPYLVFIHPRESKGVLLQLVERLRE